MTSTTSFDASVAPSRAFAFLSNARNLMVANHKGPIVEQSEGPLEAGSWFVLKFDQLRARVEYTVVEPDQHIAAQVTMSGLGSFGQIDRQDFSLTPLEDGSRTRIEWTTDGRNGCLRWGPLVRASRSAAAKRLRVKMEASA